MTIQQAGAEHDIHGVIERDFVIGALRSFDVARHGYDAGQVDLLLDRVVVVMRARASELEHVHSELSAAHAANQELAHRLEHASERLQWFEGASGPLAALWDIRRRQSAALKQTDEMLASLGSQVIRTSTTSVGDLVEPTLPKATI